MGDHETSLINRPLVLQINVTKTMRSRAFRFDINLFPVFAGSESDQSVILAIYVNSVRVEHSDENPGIASLPIMDIKGGRI
jgi:hypothetical protein